MTHVQITREPRYSDYTIWTDRVYAGAIVGADDAYIIHSDAMPRMSYASLAGAVSAVHNFYERRDAFRDPTPYFPR